MLFHILTNDPALIKIRQSNPIYLEILCKKRQSDLLRINLQCCFSFLKKRGVLSFSHKPIASKGRIGQAAVFFLLFFCQFSSGLLYFLLLLNASTGHKIPSNLINTICSRAGLNCLRIHKTLVKNVISMNLINSSLLFEWAEKLISGFFWAFLVCTRLVKCIKARWKTWSGPRKLSIWKLLAFQLSPSENLVALSSTVIWTLSRHNGDNKVFLKPVFLSLLVFLRCMALLNSCSIR